MKTGFRTALSAYTRAEQGDLILDVQEAFQVHGRPS